MNRQNMFEMYGTDPLVRLPGAAAPMIQTPPPTEGAVATSAALTAAAPALTPPAVGDLWPGQGGIYAGKSLTDDGQSLCHLVLAVPDGGDLNHADAIKWAEALDIDGHKDFSLANCHDGVTLRAVSGKFAQEWHWLKPQHASYSDFAWVQSFGDGNQDGDRKGDEYRARAVRRLVI